MSEKSNMLYPKKAYLVCTVSRLISDGSTIHYFDVYSESSPTCISDKTKEVINQYVVMVKTDINFPLAKRRVMTSFKATAEKHNLTLDEFLRAIDFGRCQGIRKWYQDATTVTLELIDINIPTSRTIQNLHGKQRHREYVLELPNGCGHGSAMLEMDPLPDDLQMVSPHIIKAWRDLTEKKDFARKRIIFKDGMEF